MNGSIVTWNVTKFTKLILSEALSSNTIITTAPDTNESMSLFREQRVGVEWDQPSWLTSDWSEESHDTQPTAIRNIMTLSS